MTDSTNKTVETVLGPVAVSELGPTLNHEHLFLDMRPISDYIEDPLTEDAPSEGPRMEDLGEIRRSYARFPDMASLDEPEVAKNEVAEFYKLGGRTIVDVTTGGFRQGGNAFFPNFNHHKNIATETGVNLIVATGYYVGNSHPKRIIEASVSEVADELIRDITEGFPGSGVKPGVIGEIGMSQPLKDSEWKVLEASCIAQKETGLPLTIHPHFGSNAVIAPEVMRFVVDQGVDPSRVNACHMDGNLDMSYLKAVLDTGVSISFDTFGLETYYDHMEYNHLPHDSQREKALIQLLEDGFEKQLMISQDVCLKHQLKTYGGYGYAHILRSIFPSLKYRGVDQETLTRIIVDNPARWLTPSK